jgi:signal transduction histidine kinase
MPVFSIPDPRRDAVFTTALVIVLIGAGASFLPLAGPAAATGALVGRALAAAGGFTAIFFRPTEEPSRTRAFWRFVAAGIAFYFLLQVYQAAATGALVPTVVRRRELLYLGRYLFAMIALEMTTGAAGFSGSDEQLRLLDNLGALLFLFALIAYVMVSPGEGAANARASLRGLYVVLDVFLILRAFTLRQTSPSAYWRAVYSWIGVAFVLRAVNNLLSPVASGGVSVIGADATTGGPGWFLLFVPLIFAARVPHPAGEEDSTVAAPTPQQGRLAPLVAYAFTVPIFHFAMERLGIVADDTSGPRETIVLVFLGAAALLLWIYQRVLIRENRRLEAERREMAELAEEARRMEGLGRLAGGVAHDFNNLLTVIRGRTELLLAESSTSEMKEDLEAIRQATRRGEGVTRQLLAFGRRQILRPEVLDLGQVVTDVAPLLQSAVSEEVRVSVSIGDLAPLIVADQGQVEMALLNLAVNAREAMPGGGLLALSVEEVELDEAAAAEIQEAQPGHYVLLTVRDTGRGMDAETRERIFEPFFTTKPFGSGAGLGLPAVHGFVRQSGGALRVESEPGRGATFFIYLPRVDATAAAGVPA